MEIIKFPISYLTSTKYITSDIIVRGTSKAYTSGVVVVNLNKLVIVEGTLTCLE